MDPLQSAVTQKRDFLQPIFPLLFLISTTFSITSAIAYMVVSMFERVFFSFVSDRILFRVLSDSVRSGSSLGFSVIGCSLGSSMNEPCSELFVIGSSLGSSMTGPFSGSFVIWSSLRPL